MEKMPLPGTSEGIGVMGEIRSVFFDVDHTLTYSKKPNWLVFWEVVTREGFSAPQEKAKEAFAKTREIYLKEGHKWKDDPGRIYRDLNRIQLEYCSIEPSEGLIDKIQAAYKDAKNQALYPDVLPTLKKLKRRGYILGTLTGGLAVDIEHRLEVLGIRSFFDHIVATGTMSFKKPDPSAFRYIAELVGLAPEKTAYIGDNYEMDIVGAENVGMRAVLIDRDDKFSNIKCERVTSLGDILNLLSAN